MKTGIGWPAAFLLAVLLFCITAFFIAGKFESEVQEKVKAAAVAVAEAGEAVASGARPLIEISASEVECPPPQKPRIVEVPKIVEVIKWKVRKIEVPKIVEVPKYIARRLTEGCKIDWKTGYITAYIHKSRSLRCLLDWQRQHVDEQVLSNDSRLLTDAINIMNP